MLLPAKKIKLAVVFGSRSVEHEVSIITAQQIFENIDKRQYEIIPIYITKKGCWLTGKALLDIKNFNPPSRLETSAHPVFLVSDQSKVKLLSPRWFFFPRKLAVDVFFPIIHGTFGEDGTIQGLFEMANAPYVGSGVSASAVGMDKIMQKDIFKNNNLSVVDYIWFLREEWKETPKKIIQKIEKNLSYPVFIKPANLGSSIAVGRAGKQKELISAIELAVLFDRRIIVEQGLENIVEINCSVIGYRNLEVSICEQPIRSGKFLSYEDKYLKGSKTKGMASLSRLIPAPISPKLTREIQKVSKAAFRVIDAAGLARIDFLVDLKREKFWICEINTLPGSLAFYLWEKSGYPFPKLIDKLVELAYERFNDRKRTTYSFDSNLLEKAGKEVKIQK